MKDEVNVSEAARLANVTEQTIRLNINNQKLSARKVHGIWLIDRASLMEYIQGVPN